MPLRRPLLLATDSRVLRLERRADDRPRRGRPGVRGADRAAAAWDDRVL